MANKDDYIVKVLPSAIKDNQVLISEIRRNGRLLTFENKGEAETWLDDINKYGPIELVLKNSTNMSSYGPDSILVPKKEEKKQYL